MEATTTTPTGVPAWISLGQYRPGADGGPVESENIRLRCPQGHVRLTGPEERSSGEIACSECDAGYPYSGADSSRNRPAVPIEVIH